VANFPTQLDIDNERHWTGFAALCLLVVFCLGSVGAFYACVLAWAGRNGISPRAAQAVATAACLAVVLPGGGLWRALRPRNKRAALYGLLLSSVLSVCAVAIIGSL
jgi:hypothetical protein